MLINTNELDYKELNAKLREANADCVVTGCLGQRFIAAGFSSHVYDIFGVKAEFAQFFGGKIGRAHV